MSERDLSLLLLDIKVSISKILEYTAGMTFESYETDSKTKDIVWDTIQYRLPGLLMDISNLISGTN